MSTPPDYQLDLLALAAQVRELETFAADRGADGARLKATIDGIFGAFIELSERRDGLDDPRRRRALELAKRIARAHETGATIEQLADRFNRSESRIYRLLEEFARHRALIFVLNPRESIPADQESTG